jgi:hypothetical protein
MVCQSPVFGDFHAIPPARCHRPLWGFRRHDSRSGENENVVYRPTSSSANATLANSISPQTIVFEAVGNNQSLDLNGFTLTTPGMIVERTGSGTGTYTFSINNGIIAGPGRRASSSSIAISCSALPPT